MANNISNSCIHPLNQRHPDRGIPANGERAEIPIEIFLKILHFLSPAEAYQVQTLCKSEAFTARFNHQRNLMGELIKLDQETLKQYQRIFTLESSSIGAILATPPSLLRFKALIDAKKLDFSKVETLEISQYKELSCIDLMAILEQCPNLTSIDCSFCDQLSDVVLPAIVAYCPKLTTINLTGCSGITNDALKAFVQNQKNLLSVTFPRHVGQDAILALAENSPNLEKLHMWFTSGIDYGAVLSALGEKCPHLRNVGLGEHLTSNTRITDGILIPFLKKFPQLTHLYLNCKTISDQSVAAIAENCPNLIDLCIHAPEMTDTALTTLAQRCPELDSVDLVSDHITDTAINTLAAHCLKIRHLFVEKCPNITGVFIAEFAKSHPHLLSLTLSNQIGVEGFNALAQYCHELKYLNAQNLSLLDEATKQTLKQGCPNLDLFD